MVNNKYDDNFSSIPSTVIPLRTNKASVPIQNNGIIDLETHREETIMSNNTYSKNEIDLKFKNLETKIDSKFDQLSQKIDFSIQHILSETKNMLLEQQLKDKIDREKERKSTNRWLFGIAISLAGLVVSIIVNFFLRK